MSITPAILVATVVALAGTVTARAQESGERVTVRTAVAQDFYAAGRVVEVLAPISGDAVLAGQEVVVAAEVTGDLIAAGESVVVRAPVGDDLRVAGRSIALEAPVAGHAVAAGQDVSLLASGRVADWLWVAGQEVTIDGTVGGELRAAASRVTVRGRIDGDVLLAAEAVEIADGASLGGDLIVESHAEPVLGAGAQIAGNVIRRTPDAMPGPPSDTGLPGALVLGVALLALLAALLLALPQPMAAGAAALRERPLAALGLGAAVLLLVPLAALLLIVTVVGALIGFALIALYLLALPVGYAAGVSGLTDALARRAGYPDLGVGRRLLALAATLLALGVLAQVPVAGPLALLALWLTGIGAIVLALAGTLRARAGAA